MSKELMLIKSLMENNTVSLQISHTHLKIPFH